MSSDDKKNKSAASITIRTHRPGDIGHVISRHGILYHQELGWPCRFESIIARIMADFIDNYDPTCERLWIAEEPTTGSFLGCVLLVRDPDREGAAKLRTLLLEPTARGTGLGFRLVSMCLEFARDCGYLRVGLWTQSCLLPARRLYRSTGFQLIKSEENSLWEGHSMNGELWEIHLSDTSRQ